MNLLELFNPNAQIGDEHPFWFWACLTSLIIAVTIAICPFLPEKIIMPDGTTYNYRALRPGMLDVIVAAVFMGMLYVRGCLSMPKAPIVWLLIIGDLLLFGSFFQIILSGQEVELVKLPKLLSCMGMSNISVTPRKLAFFIMLFMLFGARALAGIGAGLLLILTIINMIAVDQTFGLVGTVFVIAAFVSLLLQFKVPGMHIDRKLTQLFVEDFSRHALSLSREVKGNMVTAGETVKAGAKMAVNSIAKVAAGGVSLPVKR